MTTADCVSNGTLLNAQDGSVNITSWPVSGLTAGNTYFFNVAVEDEAGNRAVCTTAVRVASRMEITSLSLNFSAATIPYT